MPPSAYIRPPTALSRPPLSITAATPAGRHIRQRADLKKSCQTALIHRPKIFRANHQHPYLRSTQKNRRFADRPAERRFFSTKVTAPAPREAASSPKAPLPAKRSKQRKPSKRCPKQLNKDSRTRSPLGRKDGRRIKLNFLPRQSPPIIRNAPVVRHGITAPYSPAVGELYQRQRCRIFPNNVGQHFFCLFFVLQRF